jgi:uncharacterized protein YbjT (DUF2867 family)
MFAVVRIRYPGWWRSGVSKLDVLVVGATGRQGGAVTRALLQGGHHVRALTRSLAHPQADALRQRGARLAWADLDDTARVEESMRGADAVFIVTADAGAERRHGLGLIELARRVGTAHLVYSTHAAAGADEAGAVPHLAASHAVEQALCTSGVPYTVVCPAFFMDDLAAAPWRDQIGTGRLPLPLPEDCKLQQTTRADFARFTRLVLERRAEFVGRRVLIASDELTPVEMSATLARVIGHPVQYEVLDQVSPERLRAEFAAITAGGGADVAALRSAYPEVNWHTLDSWAKRQDWTVRQVS